MGWWGFAKREQLGLWPWPQGRRRRHDPLAPTQDGALGHRRMSGADPGVRRKPALTNRDLGGRNPIKTPAGRIRMRATRTEWLTPRALRALSEGSPE